MTRYARVPTRYIDHPCRTRPHSHQICLITSFLITSLTAYPTQIFFGLRAYTLWGRSRRVAVPIVVSSHVSLLSGVALDIYGLTQPYFDRHTTGEDLRRVERWFEELIRVRRGLQIIWVMSTLVCDREWRRAGTAVEWQLIQVLICILIIVALLRMKTNSVLQSTKSLIGRSSYSPWRRCEPPERNVSRRRTDRRVPPMVMAGMFAIVIIAGKAGPGSWYVLGREERRVRPPFLPCRQSYLESRRDTEYCGQALNQGSVIPHRFSPSSTGSPSCGYSEREYATDARGSHAEREE